MENIQQGHKALAFSQHSPIQPTFSETTLNPQLRLTRSSFALYILEKITPFFPYYMTQHLTA